VQNVANEIVENKFPSNFRHSSRIKKKKKARFFELIKTYFHAEIREEKCVILIYRPVRKCKSAQITSGTHHVKKIDLEYNANELNYI